MASSFPLRSRTSFYNFYLARCESSNFLFYQNYSSTLSEWCWKIDATILSTVTGSREGSASVCRVASWRFGSQDPMYHEQPRSKAISSAYFASKDSQQNVSFDSAWPLLAGNLLGPLGQVSKRSNAKPRYACWVHHLYWVPGRSRTLRTCDYCFTPMSPIQGVRVEVTMYNVLAQWCQTLWSLAKKLKIVF